ncbi:MAG: lytic transglycosylase domain-containing protein [Desulfobacteraceae bacterium]|jgi:soluble lytic murein transglycosylase
MKRKRIVRITKIIIAFFIIITGGQTMSHAGDIYKYVDENGVLHFTDTPSSGEKMEIFIKDRTGVKSYYKQDYSSYYTSEEFNDIIEEAASANNVSSSLIKAMIKVESNFNPNAVSPKGAKGLMQIMPGTMRDLNIDNPFNPYENVMGGSKYIRDLLRRFNNELTLALAAYNAGPGMVEKYNNVPPFEETIGYVQKVLHFHRMYQ